MWAIALGVVFVLVPLQRLIGMSVKLSSPVPIILRERPDGLDRQETVATWFIEATAC